jgi:hypothetical protein
MANARGQIMKIIIVVVLPLFLLVGCSNYVSRYYFNYERADGLTKQLVNTDEVFARYNHYFEDDFVKFHFDCEPYEIGFYLINKTNSPLRIIWDSVKVYSEYLDKNSIQISHSNRSQDNIIIADSSASDFKEKSILVKLKKEDSLYVIKPTIILEKYTWMDEISPRQNKYLLPYQLSDKDSLNGKSKKVIGKRIKLVLPIKIGSEIKYYTFLFTAKEYDILKKG